MRRQDPWCAYNQEWQWFVFADVLVEKDAIHASIPARRYGFLKNRRLQSRHWLLEKPPSRWRSSHIQGPS